MLTSSQNRSRRRAMILVVLITILAAYHIAVLVSQSNKPGYYYEYSVLRNEFSFPYLAVCVSIGFLLVEAALLALALARAPGPLWSRGLLCLLVLLPCAGVGLPTAMHMPPYYGAHVLWVLSATFFVLI